MAAVWRCMGLLVLCHAQNFEGASTETNLTNCSGWLEANTTKICPVGRAGKENSTDCGDGCDVDECCEAAVVDSGTNEKFGLPYFLVASAIMMGAP
jgi:hypothetical protein